MDRSEFHYTLPSELVAQEPLAERTASRLLVLNGDSGALRDARFPELAELLAPGDLLVLNDTRVIPARLYGRKATGGRIEILIERLTGPRTAVAQIRASKSPGPGSELELPGDSVARVAGRIDGFYELEFDHDLAAYLDAHGEVPLPPYIERPPTHADSTRYQTIYAREAGAVAAPTAGLHFDAAFLERLRDAGVEDAYITLHVGAGTFAPVRAKRLEDHRLHSERFRVSAEVCERVASTRARGGRVVAVGTTVVRALESAARAGAPATLDAETDLFIYPGFEFRAVDAIVTNFHLPESSLLMLVAAFAGTEAVLAAYEHAVAERYRFFSYGDAMFVTRRRETR